MQIINVDLIPGKVMPILHASQFDKGRALGVKLYNGGAVFELTGAEDLTAAVRKPDGNIVTETLTNAGGSLVEIITTEQMTACAGGSLCEIKIENAGDVIGTANFVLDVEKDPTDGGIESESEINNLATQVAAIVSEQYDSSNVFFDDEPTEGHGNGYAVTSQGIKRAINNVQDAVDEVNDKADTNATNIGSLSQLTTSDKSSLVGAVNSMMIKTNAAWTAKSSSAYGTALTDSINITEGVWLITWGHPTQSATLGCYIDGITTNSDISEQFMTIDNGLAYSKSCILVRFTGNSTIKLCAAGSASVSFSDIGRGFLRAIKLK